jgi:dienelactone hydrolase
MKTKKIEYHDGDVLLEGYYACNEIDKNKKPAILIAHDWSGKSEFTQNKAEKLAEMGYVGFAIDMFGKGVRGETTEEKSALIQPFVQNRALLQQRMLAAFEAIKTLDYVDTQKIGAIGFCFGGMCVLDLARTGADVKGVVSFHGLFYPAENIKHPNITAKVLALHGFDDPMVSHDQVIAFGREMTDAKANWELTIYGNAMHAFTNPKANDHVLGTVYNRQADTRSWIAMQSFFKEVFLSKAP